MVQDGGGVALDVLRVQLDQRLILVEAVFVDGQPLKGVGGAGDQAGHLGLDVLFFVADGDDGHPRAEVVPFDGDDLGLDDGPVPEDDGHQVSQADLLVGIALHHLHVGHGGLDVDGGVLAPLQLLPGAFDEVLRGLRILGDEFVGVDAFFLDGLGILHPGLPLGLVHGVAVGHRPHDVGKGEVAGLLLRAGGLAQAVQTGDGPPRLGDGDFAGVPPGLEDSAPEDGLPGVHVQHPLLDGAVLKGVIRVHLPLVELLQGGDHLPQGGVVGAGLFRPVRLLAGDDPGGIGAVPQQRLVEGDVQELLVLDDGFLRVLDDGVGGGDVDHSLVIIQHGVGDAEEAEVIVNAGKADVLAIFDGILRRDGDGDLVVVFVVDEIDRVPRPQGRTDAAVFIKEVYGHSHSSLHSTLIWEA